MSRASIVAVTALLVGGLRILNLVLGALALALALVIGSFTTPDLLAARLVAKYHATVDVDALIWALRVLGVLGVVRCGIVARILRELGAVLATLKAGEPANAAHVIAIAWALLVWQGLELILGAANLWIGRLGADTGGWSPSLGGWLSVLVALVLARVFAAGSRMRDELAATI